MDFLRLSGRPKGRGQWPPPWKNEPIFSVQMISFSSMPQFPAYPESKFNTKQ